MKIKFGHIMLLLALTVAGCAGYFSVWGLSQLFAGASVAVIIMASVLEISKVVTTTALHRYWSYIATSLKIYLTTSVIVLMLITSAGIYGFLSNAYQKTANKLELHENEIAIFDKKKEFFQKNIDDNNAIIDSKTKRGDKLSDLRDKQENRIDAANSNRERNAVRKDISSANSEIQKLNADIDAINVKNQSLTDSISFYNTKILELKVNSTAAAEVGPLKYISKLTNSPMDKVVNILILLFIFVFDPLAIALILITNRIFDLEGMAKPSIIKDTINEPLTIENNANQSLENDDDELNDGVNSIDPEPEPEPENEPEPVIPTGKIRLEDIREIKNRFSPKPKKDNNAIERIGANKIVKNGENNKVFYKRD